MNASALSAFDFAAAMLDENGVEDRDNSAVADPYRALAGEGRSAPSVTTGWIALRIVECVLGAPMVLLGLAQCGVATLFFAVSFVTDLGWPGSLMALLFSNGLMLAAPGALLCAGRSWAAWFVLVFGLVFGLVSLGLGLSALHVPFIVLGSLLAGFAIAVLVLAAVVRRGGPNRGCGESDGAVHSGWSDGMP